MPWNLILANLYMVLCFGFIVRFGKPMRDILQIRKKSRNPNGVSSHLALQQGRFTPLALLPRNGFSFIRT